MTATRLLKGATLVVVAAAWLAAAAFLWRTTVPGDLHLPKLDQTAFFTAAQRHRAEHYDNIATSLYLLEILVELAILVVLALLGRRLARGFALGDVGAGIMIAVAANLFVFAAALPIGLVAHWWDRHYGLSHRSYGSFVGEQAVGLAIQTATIAIVLAIVMLIARRWQRRWWLVVAPLFAGVGAGLVVLFAVITTATAHKLHEPQVAPAIRQLAAREGVADTRIRVQDVSDETRAVNAETTGVGPTTVVVLWNTLFKSHLSDRAIEFVAAHELGHAARRHVLKGIVWGLLFSLPLTYLLAVLTRRRGGIWRAEVVPYALLVSAILGLLTTPLQNVISRRYEAEADWRALQATHDPAAGREAFRSFTRVDLAEPNPPWWDYVLLENHPKVMQRIAMTVAWARRH
jgi:STE24 endopeptidase